MQCHSHHLPPLPSRRLSSKPAVSAKSTGAKTWSVTVFPNNTTPLFSYPEGGWAYYSIVIQQGAQSKTVTCA